MNSSDNQTGASKMPQWDVAYLDTQGFDSLTELMRAIILRTVDDYQNKPDFREEALKYMSDEEDDYVFSFYSICEHLGLNAEKTRNAIVSATTRIRTRRRAA